MAALSSTVKHAKQRQPNVKAAAAVAPAACLWALAAWGRKFERTFSIDEAFAHCGDRLVILVRKPAEGLRSEEPERARAPCAARILTFAAHADKTSTIFSIEWSERSTEFGRPMIRGARSSVAGSGSEGKFAKAGCR